MLIKGAIGLNVLTHQYLATHRCVNEPDNHCFRQRQAITWASGDLLPNGPFRTILCEIWIKISCIEEYEFEGIICKMTIICRDLNVSISRNIVVLDYDETYH